MSLRGSGFPQAAAYFEKFIQLGQELNYYKRKSIETSFRLPPTE